MSRALSLAFLPLAALASAQSSDIRQVAADGPPVLDNSSTSVDLQDSGWALIETSADNPFSPAQFGTHLVLRSPTGEIFRVPTPGVGLGQATAKVRDDGGLVAIKAGFSKLFVWRRGEPKGEIFTVPGNALNVRAVVGDNVLLDAGARGLVSVSSIDGHYSYAPTPFYETLRLVNAVGVSPDGLYAVYSASASVPGLWVFANVTTGATRAYAAPGTPTASIVDRQAQAVWSYYRDGANSRIVRYDFVTRTENTIPAPALNPIVLHSATNRKLLFRTQNSLTPNDANSSYDFYTIDRQGGAVELVSLRNGSSLATGEANSGLLSPSGGRFLFQSNASGVTDSPVGFYGSMYTRRLPTGSTVNALPARGPSALYQSEGVLSRKGESVAVVRYSGYDYTISTDREGVIRNLISSASSPKVLDVSDDGEVVIFRDSQGYRYVLIGGGMYPLPYSYVTSTPKWLASENKVICMAASDSGWEQLVAFDPLTGTKTRIDSDAARISQYEFDADAGRGVYFTSTGLRIVRFDGSPTIEIPLEYGYRHLGLRLAKGATQVGVATQEADAYGTSPQYTRVFRTTDGGQIRRTASFGALQENGNWVREPVDQSFYHVSTGRRVLPNMIDRLTTGGDPIGVWRYQDGYVFQLSASPVPEVRDLQWQVRPGGKFLVYGKVEQGGIENASTWMRVRFDGGPWYKITYPATGTVFGLPDGMHLVEAQAEDSRGRLGMIVSRGWVETDRVLPSVGAMAITSYSPGSVYATVRSTGGTRGVFDVTLNGSNRIYDNVVPTKTGYTINVSGLTPGTPYQFRFRIRDDAGNERIGSWATFTP